MRTDTRRILIVRPSALGDVCRTVPVLHSLRAADPQAVIDWVVEDRWVDAVRSTPGLNEVIAFPKRRFRAVAWNPVVMAECARWFAQLHARKYDTVIDAQGLARSGLMSLATRARVRVASSRALEFAWVAATHRVATAPDEHVVDSMLHLAEAAGGSPGIDMRLSAPREGVDAWARLRTDIGVGHRYAVVAAANRWEGKRWPATRWQDALAVLGADFARHGITDVCHIGAAGEESQVGECVPSVDSATIRHHALAGRTDVAATMAAIAGSAMVLSLDSAAAHIAVGFAVPLVALFGASRPHVDGPYGESRWCLHGGEGERLGPRMHRDALVGQAMMQRLAVAAVVDRVRARLAESKR